MEMPVCDDAAAQKLGVCLTKFFTTLDGGKEEVESTTPAAVSIKATPTPKAKPAPSPRSVVSTPPARRAHNLHPTLLHLVPHHMDHHHQDMDQVSKVMQDQQRHDVKMK